MQPGKRKMSAANARAVRVRQPAYFLPELAHVVAAADERVPFVNLAQEVAYILFHSHCFILHLKFLKTFMMQI